MPEDVLYFADKSGELLFMFCRFLVDHRFANKFMFYSDKEFFCKKNVKKQVFGLGLEFY